MKRSLESLIIGEGEQKPRAAAVIGEEKFLPSNLNDGNRPREIKDINHWAHSFSGPAS